MGEIHNLINQSKFCVIGYTSKGEKIKNDIISNILYTEIIDINDIKSYIRERKINQIINNSNNRLIIDISYVMAWKNGIGDNPMGIGNKVKFIRNICNKIEDERIIITFQMNKNFESSEKTILYSYSTPSDLLYRSDLVIQVDNDIKIIKNRYSKNQTIKTS